MTDTNLGWHRTRLIDLLFFLYMGFKDNINRAKVFFYENILQTPERELTGLWRNLRKFVSVIRITAKHFLDDEIDFLVTKKKLDLITRQCFNNLGTTATVKMLDNIKELGYMLM